MSVAFQFHVHHSIQQGTSNLAITKPPTTAASHLSADNPSNKKSVTRQYVHSTQVNPTDSQEICTSPLTAQRKEPQVLL